MKTAYIYIYYNPILYVPTHIIPSPQIGAIGPDIRVPFVKLVLYIHQSVGLILNPSSTNAISRPEKKGGGVEVLNWHEKQNRQLQTDSRLVITRISR